LGGLVVEEGEWGGVGDDEEGAYFNIKLSALPLDGW